MTDDFNFEGSNSPDPVQQPPSNEIPPVPQVQPQHPEQQATASNQTWFPPASAPQAPPSTPYQVPQQPYQQSYQQPYQQPYQQQPPYQQQAPQQSYQPYNYYQQQQPGYTPPYYPPPVSPASSGDGMAVASLILGIISVVTCCIIYVSAFCAILAIVFGIVAKNKGAGGMALAGIILGAIGLVFTIGLVLFAFAAPDFIDEMGHYSTNYSMNTHLFLRK